MDFIKQIYSVIDEKVQVFFDSKDFKFNIISKFEDKDFSIKFGVIGFIIVTLLLNIITESLNFKRFLYGSSINILSIFKFVNIIKFSLVYLIFWLIYILAYSKFLLNIKIYHGDIKDGQKGSSRFATRKEIHSQYRSIPLQRDTYSGCGGVPVARGQILVNDEESNIKIKKEVMYIDDSAVNNLIIGTTRSGKGETYIVPMIDIYSRANIKSSLVINDPKGELVAMSKEILESRGYEVFVLNIMNPDFSMSYNPLTLIKDAYKEKDFAQAQQLCNTLTYSIYHNEKSSEPMWEESSMALVNALILDLCDKCIANNEEDKITLYTVSTMLSELCKTYQSGLTEKYKIDDYFEKLPSTSVAKLQYATVNFAQGKTKGSIFVTTMSKLQKFTFDKIAKMTSKNSLDFKEIGFKSSDNDKPKAIFLVTPDYDSSLHFLASMYIQQIYYSLSVTASNGNGKCDREVIFILDEFGNMPTIQGLSSMITVCLGRRIKFNLVVQAYSQLKEKYGDQAETIEGNCGNQIYIMTNDDNTSEKFSKLIGEETITTISRSGEKFSMIKSQTESLDRRRLITSDELRRVKEGEILVVRAIKRQDVNRNKIVSYPIFNKDEYSMKYRYEYLSETFDNSKINFSELQETIKSDHKDVKLEDINFCKINKNMIEDKVNNDLEYKEVKPTNKKKLDINIEEEKSISYEEEKEVIENLNEEEIKYISSMEKTLVKNIIGGYIDDSMILDKIDTIKTFKELEEVINNKTIFEVIQRKLEED